MDNTFSKQRRQDLDYAKGIGILLMIFMHCGDPDDYKFKICISAFFMPIFYVICGILAAIKHPDGLSADDFPAYFARRFRQILVPYFVFGLVLIAFFQGLHLIAGKPLSVKNQLFRLISFQGIESMWFLTRYLIAEITLLFVILKLKKPVQLLLTAVGVAVIGVQSYIGMPSFWLFRVLIGAWIGLIFAYIGFLIENNKLLPKISEPVGIALFMACGTGSLYNGPIGVGGLELQNPFLFFANAIGLSIVVLWFCHFLSMRQASLIILENFGRNTIVVVCTNNLLIEIIRLLDYKITGNFLLRTGLWGNIIFAGIMMILEYHLIRLFSGSAGILFRKTQK